LNAERPRCYQFHTVACSLRSLQQSCFSERKSSHNLPFLNGGYILRAIYIITSDTMTDNYILYYSRSHPMSMVQVRVRHDHLTRLLLCSLSTVTGSDNCVGSSSEEPHRNHECATRRLVVPFGTLVFRRNLL
jgi:hypothetical protein